MRLQVPIIASVLAGCVSEQSFSDLPRQENYLRACLTVPEEICPSIEYRNNSNQPTVKDPICLDLVHNMNTSIEDEFLVMTGKTIEEFIIEDQPLTAYAKRQEQFGHGNEGWVEPETKFYDMFITFGDHGDELRDTAKTVSIDPDGSPNQGFEFPAIDGVNCFYNSRVPNDRDYTHFQKGLFFYYGASKPKQYNHPFHPLGKPEDIDFFSTWYSEGEWYTNLNPERQRFGTSNSGSNATNKSVEYDILDHSRTINDLDENEERFSNINSDESLYVLQEGFNEIVQITRYVASDHEFNGTKYTGVRVVK